MAVSLLACVVALALPGIPDPGAPALPAGHAPEAVARLQSHYRAALDELAAADVTHLDAVRRARRAEALAELAAYCERGVFGMNLEASFVREPHFVDAGGRLCAVANLMAASGERVLVDQVAATDNHAYVLELAGLPALASWLDSVGLSLVEAARIQAPSTIPPSNTQTNLAQNGNSGFFVPPMGPAPNSANRWGAGAQPGAGPTTMGAAGERAAALSSAGREGSRGSPTTWGDSGRTSDLRSGPVWTPDGSEDGWWLWWEMNKLRFIAPNRLAAPPDAALGPLVRGIDPGSGSVVDLLGSGLDSAYAAAARAELLPLLVELTQAEDGMLRARAAVTLGRLGGAEAVAPLTAMLADSQMLVRHAAILGLGATGRMEAAPTLLHLATSGSLPGGDGAQLSSWARPLAFVALGLGRRHGMSPVLDGFVADLARTAAAERSDLGTAALLYQTLSPCDALSAYAQEVLDHAATDPVLRCRATETLAIGGDTTRLPRLTHLLGDGQLEVRRSAALAMSGLQHPLAAPALQTAYELEDEPVVRGLLLLALAEQGGDDAREFLLRAARGGPQASRPWAALGLGLMARSIPEPGGTGHEADRRYDEIGSTLRAGLGSDVNHAARGAWMLACGLARDAESAPRLRHAMVSSKDQRIRMFAALSLAMIGDPESRPVMLEQLTLEEAPLAIVGLTQALGALGVAEDGPALVSVVQQMREPSTQTLLAIALAFHGSESAVSGLMQIAHDETASAAARASAVDGLGLLLDSHKGLMLQELAANSNFYAFPDWVNGLLTTFTL